MSQMASHEPFGHLQPKLWAKEGPEVKLAIWLPTTKNQESTSSQCLQQECDMALEALNESYNFGSNLVPIWARGKKLWTPKVPGVQAGTVTGLHFGSPGKKSHLDVASAWSCREYYKGEGGGFPRVQAVVSQVSPSCPWLVPTPKGCRMSSNQLVVGFGCRTD
jgi:hypothetical protein